MAHFMIRWDRYGYIPTSHAQARGYCQTATNPLTKTWKTRKNAERFLSLKDPGYARMCVVEEIP